MNGRGEGVVTTGPAHPGNQFLFTVHWGGSRPIEAQYTGTFGADHRLTGISFDKANPGAQTTWVSDRRFN
jgi:hypothetical protein